jgi:ectoine hydroxylase-related dioxygenase (phytanoyl-CoA dioxygenase family)
MWRNTNALPNGVDVLCRAGAVVIWNNSNIHAGTVRQTSRPRRSLGMTFYSQLAPPLAAARTKGRPDKTPEFWARFVGKHPDLLRWVPMVGGDVVAKL